jgi:hypothetical protein
MNIREMEILWYRKNGKYKDRITADSNGDDYVIGDWSWNRMTENKDKQEFIETDTRVYLGSDNI